MNFSVVVPDNYLTLPPKEQERIIALEVERLSKETSARVKSGLPFLHSGVWDEEDGATDISENHDHYLYEAS